MKKIYILLIAILVSAAVLSYSGGSRDEAKTMGFFGDADAMGSEDDANEKNNYDWMMLQDPATGKIPAHIREKEMAFAATLPKDGNPGGVYKTTANTWEQRGPWNVGGRTRAFAVDVSNENNILAGTTSGGMWRSTDAGQTWKTTIPSTQYQSVSCLAQDLRSGHTNTWYYGTGEAYGASASATGAFYLGNGIYKSTDGGATWNVLASTTSTNVTGFDTWGDLVWNIATDASNTTQDIVYAAANGGIYRSVDGGGTWTQAKGSSGSYFTDVAVSAKGIIYATMSSDGSSKGIYRSADGITFTDITPANFPATFNRVKIGISPAEENQVFFLANTPGFGKLNTNFQGDVEGNSLWKYKYISGTGSGTGGVWDDRSVNIPASGTPFDKFFSQGSYDLVVKVKPDDTNAVFIGGTNIYRSTTAFADSTNTTQIGGYKIGATLPVVDMYANQHPDQHELVFLPSDPNKMLSSNDGGVYRTADNRATPVVWNSMNNGYINTMFYTCAIDHAATDDIVIGGAQDNGSWYTNNTNLQTPWVTPRGGDGSYCAIADGKAAYYFSIQNGKVMRARLDASGNVTSFARIDPQGGTGYLFINPFTIDPNNNNIMYLAGGKYLWRNDNLDGIPYASNWDSITTNWVKFPDSVAIANSKITAITACKTPANRVYFGTSSQKLFRIDNANTGTPKPKDISSTDILSPFPGGANISCVAVDPTNGDHVMVVFSNYNVQSLFYSADGGTSWQKVGGNLENTSGSAPSCRWASIIPTSDGVIYLVGTSVGLFATTELNGSGTWWTQQGTNEIGSSIVTMIDYRASDGLVTVATHSHGIFSTHIKSINDVTSVTDVGHGALTMVNYPNPFRDATTIQFNLTEKADINLAVYDGMGKLVKQLVQQTVDAGEKRYVFNGAQLAPGIYYCVLRKGLYTETKQLMLVR